MNRQNESPSQLEPELPPRPRKRSSRGLVIAEYTALSLSVAGTIVAFVSKQAAYAAAPISVSLFLNLLNRQRLNRQIEQQAQLSAQQAQVLGHLGQGLEPLQAQVSGLQLAVEHQEQLERDRPDPVAQLTEQLSNQFTAQLDQAQSVTTEQVQALQERLAGLASQLELERLQAEFSQQLTPLTEQIAAQKQDSEQQSQALQQLKQQLGAGQIQLEALANRLAAIEQIEGDRPDFAAKINQLHRAMAGRLQVLGQLFKGLTAQEQTTQEQTTQLQAALAQQTQQTHALSAQLGQLEAELNRYLQGHNSTHQTLAANSISQIDELTQRLRWLEAQIAPEATLCLNLGIDFGTRFTKVCYQNLSDDQSEIIPFQPYDRDLSAVFILSQIGIWPDGRLLAGLTETEWQKLQRPGGRVLDGLKMRLADLDLGEAQPGWRLEAFPELDEPEMVENLCAFYLSRVIGRSQTWVRQNRPQLVANEIIEWSANVGVPVAYCDQPRVGDRFNRVLSLAWLLSNQPQTEEMTLERLKQQMDGLRSQLDPVSNCHAIPEIAAETWSFLNSRAAQDGYYLFFDIGDGTLDGCAFHYERRHGDPNIEFYYAQICPLGVRSVSQALSQELNLSVEAIHGLLGSPTHPEALIQSQQRKLVQQMLAKVIIQGGNIYRLHHPGDKVDAYRKNLNIFLGGGGSKIPFFQQLPHQTHQEFGHRNSGIQGYDVQELPAPKQLEMNGISPGDFHRFAVAFGLATDYENLAPSITLPKQMEREKPKTYASSQSQTVKYEDTKDAV